MFTIKNMVITMDKPHGTIILSPTHKWNATWDTANNTSDAKVRNEEYNRIFLKIFFIQPSYSFTYASVTAATKGVSTMWLNITNTPK